jgi:imidazole glycerol-phosphate synthase subunit HisH
MIVVIDYGIGNLGSVANALSQLKVPYQLSGNPQTINSASGLILPGVGAAGVGMKNLKDRQLDRILIRTIAAGKPFLGICLGMQLLFESSEENNTKCLGILKGTVKRFRQQRKVPQIGWNKVTPNNNYFYFVNSYYCLPQDQSIIAGMTEYGEKFASIVVKDNILGVQFHPEKSGQVGFQLLKNFIKNYVN